MTFVTYDEYYLFLTGLAQIYEFYRGQRTGATRITFERFDADVEEESESRWLQTLAHSQDKLARIAREAYEEHLAGLTEDLDPDIDPM